MTLLHKYLQNSSYFAHLEVVKPEKKERLGCQPVRKVAIVKTIDKFLCHPSGWAKALADAMYGQYMRKGHYVDSIKLFMANWLNAEGHLGIGVKATKEFEIFINTDCSTHFMETILCRPPGDDTEKENQ